MKKKFVFIKSAFFFISALLLCSCMRDKNYRIKKIPFIDSASMNPGGEFWFLESFYAVSQVVYKDSKGEFSFTSMVEYIDGRLMIAGISAMGTRLFLLEAQKERISYQEQMLFKLPFEPRFLFRDFILCFAQTDIVDNILHKATVLHEKKHRRITTHDGLKIFIDYENDNFFEGEVALTRSDKMYSIIVETVEYEVLDTR